jgi:hypothetical protein
MWFVLAGARFLNSASSSTISSLHSSALARSRVILRTSSCALFHMANSSKESWPFPRELPVPRPARFLFVDIGVGDDLSLAGLFVSRLPGRGVSQ